MGEGPYSDIGLTGSRETCLQPGGNKRKRRRENCGNAAQGENSAKSCYLCVCLYTLVRHCAMEYARRRAIVRLSQSGRRVYSARVLSVDQKVLLGSDTNIDLSRARSTGAIVSRIATRAASSTSTLQHSHTIAVRRCAAVLRETPSPPPIARYAAMHMGHFGSRASAMLGSANAAALRVRGLDLFSVPRRPGGGPGAASLEGEAALRRQGQTGCAAVFCEGITHSLHRGSTLSLSARCRIDRAASPTRRSCRRDRVHCGLWASGRESDSRRG